MRVVGDDGVRLEAVDELPFETWTTGFHPRRPDGSPMAIEELPLVRAITEREPAHGPVLITGADGVEHTIEITAFPLEGGRGRLIGGVAMFWEPRSA